MLKYLRCASIHFHVLCTIKKKVPIMHFHCKNLHEMLDTGSKIGKIMVLTSEYARKIGYRLFPNVCRSFKFPRNQPLTAQVCCNALVPFGTATLVAEEEWSREGSTDNSLIACNYLLVGSNPTFDFLSFLNNNVKNSHS